MMSSTSLIRGITALSYAFQSSAISALSSNDNSGASAAKSTAKASSLGIPSTITNISGAGMALSSGEQPVESAADMLYSSAGLTSAAAFGQGVSQSSPAKKAVDDALVSALMLALTQQNQQDMTSALALKTNPAVAAVA